MKSLKKSVILSYIISIVYLTDKSFAFTKPERIILPTHKGWLDHSYTALPSIQEPIISHTTTTNTWNGLILGNENVISSDFVIATEFDQTFDFIITFGDKMNMGSIAIGAMIIIVFLAGIAIFFSNVVIPQAADELEKQVNEKYPDLYEE